MSDDHADDTERLRGAMPNRRRVIVVGEAPIPFAPDVGRDRFEIGRCERDTAAADPDRLVGADVVVWCGPAPAAAVAERLVSAARRRLWVLVVVAGLDAIDDWSLGIGVGGVDFVVAGPGDDGGGERAVMAAIERALQPAETMVSDQADAARRLAELGDEVARIAQALTGNAAGNGAGPGGAGTIADRRLGYNGQGAGAAAPITAAAVRGLIRARRQRDRHFPGLFADPAWDILLDLYAARLEGASVAVSSLCIASGVPPTTALRWISGLTEQGLLCREADAGDRRRVFVALSDAAVPRIEACIASILSMGAPVA